MHSMECCLGWHYRWVNRCATIQHHDSLLLLGLLGNVPRSPVIPSNLTIDFTGILQSAAFWVSNRGGTSGRRMFFYFYLMMTGLSAVLGNDPVILSGTAFLVYFTKVAEVSPVAWLFSEFASCNTASMLLFVGMTYSFCGLTTGNPTNVVLCEGFKVNYLAFTAYTFFPFLGCSVAGLMALYIQFTKNHIPKKVTAPQVDPKSVLLDPVSAIVGSIGLLITLALITGTGFAGLSAWMISMPAAVSKAIFDLIWDLVRERPSDRPTRTRSGEEELEMHHVNSEVSSESRRPRIADEPKLTHRPKRPAADGESEDSQADMPDGVVSSVLQTTAPEMVSLGAFLMEKIDETKLRTFIKAFEAKFPAFSTTLRRLPYALLPFAFSQFILVEALAYTGWISVFSSWLAIVVGFSLPATVFVIGVLSVILCNVSGTNIGATILLVKVLQHPNFADQVGIPPKLATGGMLALAVGSNIGAVSFTFSASLAGISSQCQTDFDRLTVARDLTTKRNHYHRTRIRKMECPSIIIHDSYWMRSRPRRRNNSTYLTAYYKSPNIPPTMNPPSQKQSI